MHWIDWVMVVLPLLATILLSVYTRRFVQGVADYMAAGRCAGRYLICNARGEADSGLSNAVAQFQAIMISGFVLNWWGAISAPILLMVGITGFVIYRYRETRVLTLPQFFEVRYSPRFRLFMGGLCFLAGILNYGIFPAVAAKFFIYFLHLPTEVTLLGIQVSTAMLIMAGYLSIALGTMLIGGQVTLMVSDCIEGIFSHAAYLVVIGALFAIVGWHQIEEWLLSAPQHMSPVDPFDASKVQDFNVWMTVMGLFGGIYGTMAWQNRSGFNSAGRTAHESRMGGILGHWRGYARTVMLVVLVMCAMTYLKHDDYAAASQPAREAIAELPKEVRQEVTVPVALSYLLPVGVKGLFVLVMILGLISADSSHLHSWGSILVQDVILPLRGRPLEPREHIWLLRCAQIGVGLFAFTFSLTFQITDYIWMWWAITGALFTAGAGAAIIGGLYWSRGTTQGAWTAALVGSTLSITSILVTSFWEKGLQTALLSALPSVQWPKELPFNQAHAGFCTTILAGLSYVVVSLLTCKHPYNMDRLLHRGAYKVKQDEVESSEPKAKRNWLHRLMGFDENFTRGDKFVAGGIFVWMMIFFAITVGGSLWVAVAGKSFEKTVWADYWLITGIALPLLISAVTLIWFGLGGIRDLWDFFHLLRTRVRDHRDDGRMESHTEHPPVLASTPATAATVTKKEEVPEGASAK